MMSQTLSLQKQLTIDLSSTEYLSIREDALRAPAPVTPNTIQGFLALAKKSVYKNLCTGKLAVFNDVLSGRLTPPCIFIENAPIDEELPPTPSDGRWSEQKKTYVSEFVLAGIMQTAWTTFLP